MEVEELLSSLIRINSENPPGREAEVAAFLKNIFDAAGIENQILSAGPGRDNFIACAGSGPRSLLFLSHADTVQAGDGWDFAPFSGDIREGEVLGRGALDCKGMVAAEAHAMLQLAKAGKLKGRLIFAATADEESGGKAGIKFLQEKHPDLLKADFCINEGGILPLKLCGKAVNFVQVGEKGAVWTKLIARGVSAHGSMPDLGDNAIEKMGRAIGNLSAHQPKIELLTEVRQLIQELVNLKGVDLTVNEGTVDRAIALFEDPAFNAYLKAVTRMTISPNVIKGGARTNIVPDYCESEIDIRVLPGQDEGMVVRELRAILGKEIEIQLGYNPPTFSPAASDHYRLIADTIREVAGSENCLPCLSSGGTDSRHLRPTGMPCYGVELMTPDFDEDLRKTPHGKNERIDVASLKLRSRFLMRLAEKYLA